MPIDKAGSPDWTRVTAILVTHHSAAVIGDCLQSFKGVPNIIVIDNASDDETLDIVREMTPQAHIVKNKIGVGYGGAANQGLNLVKTEFALTVNPDSIVSPDAVSALLDAADKFPDASIICPQTINLDGSPEPTHDVVMFDRHLIPSPYNKRRDEAVPEGDVCAAFVSGAVSLIRISVIHQLGGFDENLYLYFEDDDLCMRMRAAGYPLILTPHARIMHINAGSVRPSLHYKWEKFWNYGWARLYIEKKYNGTGVMLGLSVRHVLRFLVKALANTLSLKFEKAWRDWARCTGTLAFLVGVRAINPSWKAINERERQSQPK
ncbi:MAG: glycosyltransferase family 2 protein [Proteobacteria bacterium]|nr:glycosyltransferase family 2 protein [Pseudomonadota bacterium]